MAYIRIVLEDERINVNQIYDPAPELVPNAESTKIKTKVTN